MKKTLPLQSPQVEPARSSTDVKLEVLALNFQDVQQTKSQDMSSPPSPQHLSPNPNMAPDYQTRSKAAANLVPPKDQAEASINQQGPGDDIPFHIYILNPPASFSTTTDPFKTVPALGDASNLTKELSDIVKRLFQSLLDNMNERQEQRIPAIRAPDNVDGHELHSWQPDKNKIAPEMRNEFWNLPNVVQSYTISYLGGRYDDFVLPLGYYVLRDYRRDQLLVAGMRHEDVAALVNELCRGLWPNGREGIYEKS